MILRRETGAVLPQCPAGKVKIINKINKVQDMTKSVNNTQKNKKTDKICKYRLILM